MRYDFGYTEEGHLGKPYNIGLLKRLFPYARPYRRTIFFALALTIVLTLFDLSIPYLPKVAIDRYILSYWYLVDRSRAPHDMATEFDRRYGHLVETAQGEGPGFISHTGLRESIPLT